MNDLDFVVRAVDLLWSRGIRTWVFGGWGEELRGLAPPREHADLDLLYPARDWDRVDELRLDWVDAKRLPWKRAFVLEGTVVELFLVERDERGVVHAAEAPPPRLARQRLLDERPPGRREHGRARRYRRASRRAA